MWLETITVRTPALSVLEPSLPMLWQQLAAEAPEVTVAVYTRHPTNTDLSIHLLHDGVLVEPSAHGIRLADALRQHGSVDHGLWVAPSNLSNSNTPLNLP